ncbi:MAG: cation diffusion facilitator family transporter [Bacteroidales bacterium]|nr:cation diffusion facilitator family transporter [Bacteroidales bacterium]MCF8334425.1 cation diffusion facilitator family transporter [Bacteroidales bacterium]
MSSKLQKVRNASIFSTVLNGILALGKITIGFISGSLAVLSDGLDSAGDVLTSIIMIVTARLMKKPPNIKFPYGYDKAESIASKAISFFIFFAGAQLVFSAVRKLFVIENNPIPGELALWVTAISIAVKIILSLHQHKRARQLQSHMLKANARNMQNDILISGSVLLGLLLTQTLEIYQIDVIIGLGIGLYIMWTAYRIFLSSSTELMDGVEDPSIYNKVFEAVAEVKGATNPHRARIRQMGNQYLVAIDIEVDGAISVAKSHEIAAELEQSIKKKIPNVYDILVHIEPYGHSEKDEKFGISHKNFPEDL